MQDVHDLHDRRLRSDPQLRATRALQGMQRDHAAVHRITAPAAPTATGDHAVTTKIASSLGTMVPTTNADIAAFRVAHALDQRLETNRIDVDAATGMFVVEECVIFEIF